MSNDMKPGRWNASLVDSIFNKGAAGRRALTFPKWDGPEVAGDLPADARRAEPADFPAFDTYRTSNRCRPGFQKMSDTPQISPTDGLNHTRQNDVGLKC